MKEITINYTYGVATMITPYQGDALQHFYELANQCFGIRKSISDPKVISVNEVERPTWWREDYYESLKHSGGDIIVWNQSGDKVKSEWD